MKKKYYCPIICNFSKKYRLLIIAMKKLMLVFHILLLSSCSIYESTEQSFLSSEEVSINHEYDEIVNQKLLWNDIFSVAKPTYFVYFYSLVCQNCNSIKKEC